MPAYRLSAAAQADLANILAWTHERFGESARQRYEALIVSALRDISVQPDRVGSIERPELGAGVRSWHLRLSRERARLATGVVRRPRHFLIYRMDDHLIVVGRVLHDAMELVQHLRARAKITSHFRIPSSRHLWPVLSCEILTYIKYAAVSRLPGRPNLTQIRARIL